MPALLAAAERRWAVNGDGIPDILVANSGSNNVYLLPGVGRGFFNDKNPVIYQTSTDPVSAFVGNFDARVRVLETGTTINAGSNGLTFFSSFGTGRSIASGGRAYRCRDGRALATTVTWFGSRQQRS